jgi:hypothetical protein
MNWAVWLLAGILVFREACSYMERKRMSEMLYSKSMGEYKSLTDETARPAHTNPILKQREAQRADSR